MVKKVVEGVKAEEEQVKLRQDCDVEIEEQNHNFLVGMEVFNDVDNDSIFIISINNSKLDLRVQLEKAN